MCKKLGKQGTTMSARGGGGSDVHEPKWCVGAARLAASGVAPPAVLGPPRQLHPASSRLHRCRPFDPLGPKCRRPRAGLLTSVSEVRRLGDVGTRTERQHPGDVSSELSMPYRHAARGTL